MVLFLGRIIVDQKVRVNDLCVRVNLIIGVDVKKLINDKWGRLNRSIGANAIDLKLWYW